MSDIAPGVELAEAEREALIDLVLRGMHTGEPSAAQTALVEAGYATIRGTVLVPTQQAGAAVSAMLRLPDDDPDRERTYQLFEAFLPVNRKLREVCTDWQRMPDGTPNDHADASWDAGVRDRLDTIDSSIGRVLKRLAAVDGAYASYREQLTVALEKFDAGDASALASPLSASYHNVWMWLHQRLLLTLGISRAEDEALEERLVQEQSR
jgi:hypothetical protein